MFSVGSQRIRTGRDLEISDESERVMNERLKLSVARGLSFCETIAEDVLRPLYHNNRSPTCSTLRSLRTTSPQRSSPNRRIVPTAERKASCQLASFTLVTIATTVRCAKASFGHALIGASSHGKRRTSWGNVNRRPRVQEGSQSSFDLIRGRLLSKLFFQASSSEGASLSFVFWKLIRYRPYDFLKHFGLLHVLQ
jgi:hypothetical protein